MNDQNPPAIQEPPQPPVNIIVPPKPRPTADLERDADTAMRYLEQLTSSPRLDPELRMTLNDIKNTVKMLKQTVVRMTEEAETAHDKLVELVRSQRLM